MYHPNFLEIFVELSRPKEAQSIKTQSEGCNPKTELVIRDTAAVSDSEARLMPKDGLISAGAHLAIHISIFVCVRVCVCIYVGSTGREKNRQR